jgi:hypothetical protein
MKHVGILTFHYIDNYGALIQAYALKKAIDKFEGYEAEIINYIPENFEYYPYECGPDGKKKMELKVSKIHQFLEKRAGVKYPPISSINGLEYDIYCVGSDQVWNFAISNYDTTYLFDTIRNDKKKISYASSIGQNIDKLDSCVDIFKCYLSEFSNVSVREAEHNYWLKEKCKIDSEIVLDPTFLLKVDDYKKVMSTSPQRDHSFILFIWYKHDNQLGKALEFVNTISRKYKLPVVHNVINIQPYLLADDDGYMFYGGVEEFVWYIYNASFIVTNSYHTMLFSIHFKKPFYVFLVDSMRSRFDTLGERIGICDRYVTSYIKPEVISDVIDYEQIYELIEPLRKDSWEYLKKSLE